MKLKTLKDIDVWAGNKERFVAVDKLKEEAIKWVKEDMKDSVFIPCEIIPKPWTDYGAIKMPNGKYCKCDPEFTCMFHREGKRVMKMNNITEEDLKEKAR